MYCTRVARMTFIRFPGAEFSQPLSGHTSGIHRKKFCRHIIHMPYYYIHLNVNWLVCLFQLRHNGAMDQRIPMKINDYQHHHVKNRNSKRLIRQTIQCLGLHI